MTKLDSPVAAFDGSVLVIQNDQTLVSDTLYTVRGDGDSVSLLGFNQAGVYDDNVACTVSGSPNGITSGKGAQAVYAVYDGDNSGIGIYDLNSGENSFYQNGLFALTYDDSLARIWYCTYKSDTNAYASFGYIDFYSPDAPVLLRDDSGYTAKDGFLPDFESYTDSCIIEPVENGAYLTVRILSSINGSMYRVDLYDSSTLTLLCRYVQRERGGSDIGYRFGNSILIPWCTSASFLKITLTS